MQQLAPIIAGLRSLATFLEEESATSAAFARRLQLALAPAPAAKAAAAKKKAGAKSTRKGGTPVPDQFHASAQKGGDEFLAFLLSLDLAALKAIIKREGLDPGKTVRSSQNTGALASLIFDRTTARMRRGSAFLPPKAVASPPAPVNPKAKKKN